MARMLKYQIMMILHQFSWQRCQVRSSLNDSLNQFTLTNEFLGDARNAAALVEHGANIYHFSKDAGLPLHNIRLTGNVGKDG